MKSKNLLRKHSLHITKYLFLRNGYVCLIWIFIYDSDQAQITSVEKKHKMITFRNKKSKFI